MAKIEENVGSLVKDKIEDLGYELYDVLFFKEGPNKILRIVIDNENGISLDDCEKVNNEVKDLIDEEDLIKEQYYLEISSPGIERLLRKDWQLKKYQQELDIQWYYALMENYIALEIIQMANAAELKKLLMSLL